METEAGDEGSFAGFRSNELAPISIARASKRTQTYTTQVIFLADQKNNNECQSDHYHTLAREARSTYGLNVEPSMPSLSSWAERLHSDRGNF